MRNFGLLLLIVGFLACAQPRAHKEQAQDAAPAKGACPFVSCTQFKSVGEALRPVLARAPLVIAFGEAHGRAGETARTTVQRFQDDLLPVVGVRGGAIVQELVIPNPACSKAVVKKVRKVSDEITQGQHPANQARALNLGTAAIQRGMMPYALLADCGGLGAIAGGGDQDVAEVLKLVARLAGNRAADLLPRVQTPDDVSMQDSGICVQDAGVCVQDAGMNVQDAGSTPSLRSVAGSTPSLRSAIRPPLLMYGGALHNDLVPPPGTEDFSFGRRVADLAQGRYEEVDLVLPEQVQPTDVWKRRAWYAHYSPQTQGHETWLYEVTPHSWVLFLPRDPRL